MEYKVILVSIDNLFGLLRWLTLAALVLITIYLFLNRKAKAASKSESRKEKKSWLLMALFTLIAAPFLILQIIKIEKPTNTPSVPDDTSKNEDKKEDVPDAPETNTDDTEEKEEKKNNNSEKKSNNNGNNGGNSGGNSGESSEPDEPEEPTEVKYRLTITNATIISPESSDKYLPGTEITVVPNNKQGYHFDHWASSVADLQDSTENPLTFEMPEGNLTLAPSYEPNTDTAYKVLYRQMQFAENDYQVYETYNGTGTTGQEITPEVREYAGFNKPAAQTTTISANGDTVVTYDYVRQKRAFILVNPAYITSSHENGDYYYETEITVSAREKQGYHFVKWSNNQTTNSITITLISNTEIEAIYAPNTDTAYKVEYKQMNVDGDNYVTYETYNGTGTSDAEITPEVRTYTGFKSPDPQTTTINPNGKTVVTYRYDRIKRHFEITDRTHIVAGSAEDGNYNYGKVLTITAEQVEDYELTWSDGNTDYTRQITIGTEDISLTPVYTEVQGIDVNVVHQKANLGGGYTVADTELLTVKPGESLTPAAKTYEGFTSPSTQTVTATTDDPITVTYNYDRVEYDVHFDAQGGNAVAGTTRLYEEQIGTLPTTTRTNFTFKGWYTNTGFTDQVATSTTILAETTFYAKWEPENKFPTVWSHEGECEFHGSASDNNITGEECQEYTNRNYIDTGIKLFSEENYNKDFEVYFEIEEYGQQDVKQATLFNAKYENKSQGYPGLTIRRYESSNTEMEVTETISSTKANKRFSNSTTKVLIQRIDGHVYYQFDDGEKTELQNLNEITEQDHNMPSWFGAAPGSNGNPDRFFTGKLKNMYIKLGKYTTIETRYVNFNANSGEGTMARQAINSNESIKLAKNNFKKTYYDFVKWNTKADGTGTNYTDEQIINGSSISGELTLYAIWSEHFYPITYNLDGGTVSSVNPTEYNELSNEIILNNPTKVGYDFVGWSGSNGDTPELEVRIPQGSSGSREYTANFNRHVYTITFNLNGGEMDDELTRTINGGDPIGDLPTPTREEYIFQGWYQELEAGARISKTTVPTSSTTYYAHWATARSLYLTVKAAAEDEEYADADIYTGDVTDTLGDTINTDIYYYKNQNPDNNVIFGGYCWQIVRTTSTGGVKMIYNGEVIDGKCTETEGAKRTIGNSAFNDDYGNIFPGYMVSDRISMNRDVPTENTKFGSSFTYENGTYTLVDVVNSRDDDHRFSCTNEQTSCDALRYFTGDTPLVEIKDVATAEEATNALRDNKVDSRAKSRIDNWYRNKLTPYTSFLEDAVYCNNRNMNSSTTALNYSIDFTENVSNEVNLTCSNIKDRMTTSNNVAKLTYPVGLITKPEALIGKSQENTYQASSDDYYLNIGTRYWMLTPVGVSHAGFSAYMNIMGTDGKINYGYASANYAEVGLRPAITLKDNTMFDYGDGSKENPYYINTHIEVVKVTFDENKADNAADEIIVKKGQTIGSLPIVTRRGYNLRGWFIDGNENKQLTEESIINTDTTVVAIWDEQKFHSDSWETVIENAYNNNLDDYNVGDYKEITLKKYGTVFVRIANKTTAEECNLVNYSHTACGFVLEFDEILFVKTTASSLDQQYYITNEFYNNLPELVKNAIIETKVGEWDKDKKKIIFKKQKMYEPSLLELLGQGDRRYAIDRLSGQTRQLDYYRQKEVNSVNSEAAAKHNSTNTSWTYSQWTYRQTQETGYTVRRTGGWFTCNQTDCTGLSPMFRLGREYTITYEANGGTASFSSAKVEAGGVLGELPIAQRDGYDFVGWFADQELTEQVDSSYNPASTMTIYAKWSERKFHSDSWETIARNVRNGTTDDYEIGDIKEIEFDNNEDGVNEVYKLRLINKTTPAECESSNFSQTACGFVVEFVGIIESRAMGNNDWPTSSVRAYLNTDFFNKLPNELQEVILKTDAISGRTYEDSAKENYHSIERIFVESARELNITNYSYWDAAYNDTRAMDYYANGGSANKTRYNNSSINSYWLRSAHFSSSYSQFHQYTYNSGLGYEHHDHAMGIAPAFRIEQFHTVRLDAKSGTLDDYDKQIIIGDKIGELPTPTREGYDFDGWYNDENYTSEVDENEIITSDKTVYAKWIARHYTLTFNSNGGSEVADMDIVYDQPIGILPEDPTKQDNTFVGWFTSGRDGQQLTSDYICKGDINAIARWSYQADITFDANGGLFSDQEQQRVATYTINDGIGRKYAHTSNINDNGIASGAYSSSLSQTTTVSFPGSSFVDIELWYGTESTADWVAIYPKDVTPASNNSTSATISGGALSGTETRNTERPSDTSSYHRIYHVEDDTIKFYFKSDSTIAYYGYYAIIVGEDKVIDHVDNYEEPTRVGARFAGWYTGPECTDDQAYNKDNAREAMTLYAKWVYDIDFDANGGIVTTASRSIKAGDTIGKLPEPTRDGYLFMGWYSSLGDSGELITKDYIPASHITLYATWGEQTLYNLAVSDSVRGYAKKLDTAPADSIDENDNEQGVYYYTQPITSFIFGNQCWRYIRTTSDGGTKFQYTGKYVDGKCTAIADYNSIGQYEYNFDMNPGYMYNKTINNAAEEKITTYGDTVRWARSVEYENGSYRLIDTTTARDSEHRYLCSYGAFGYCSEVIYYPPNGNNSDYYVLNGQQNIKQIIDDMVVGDINVKDSNAKTVLENWYRDNLLEYDQYVNKNTIYCNNRDISDYGSFTDPTSDKAPKYNYQSNGECMRDIDKFAVNNPVAPLRYGVAMTTYNEVNLMLGNQGLGNLVYMTPATLGNLVQRIYRSYNSTTSGITTGKPTDKYYLRPVITLVKGLRYTTEKVSSTTYYHVEAEPSEKTHYEVAFVDPTKESRKTSKVIEAGNAVGQLPQPTANDKTFGGWYTDTNYTTEVSSETIPEGHATYYAKWNSNNLNEQISLKYYNGDTNIDKFTGHATDTMDDLLTTHDILYYKGAETDEAKINNHVLIGDTCWRIVRTTTSGGTKLIYDGESDESGRCNNTGEDTILSAGRVNYQSSELGFAAAGYMYNRSYPSVENERIRDRDAYANVYTESYEYYDGAYHLTGDVRIRADNNHPYSCPDGVSTTCSTLRFYFGLNATYLRFYNLVNGMSFYDIIDDMLAAQDVNKYDSKAKSTVDNWYENKMTTYSNLFEDAVYCNDRNLLYYLQKKDSAFIYIPAGSIVDDVYALTEMLGRSRYSPNSSYTGKYSILTCTIKTDKFAVGNTSAKLKYPVGLITFDEAYLATDGSTESWLGTGVPYWTMTPAHWSFQSLDMDTLTVSSSGYIGETQSYRSDNDYKRGIRPVVSLKHAATYSTGDGTSEQPYVIDLE
jgi:uncharacterized repeat protein (TIGR02543 family)